MNLIFQIFKIYTGDTDFAVIFYLWFWFMKKISREQAEALFLDSEVITSSIHQDKDQLCVVMTLSTHQSCHVTYNFKSKEKTYYIEEGGAANPDPLLPPK